MSSDLLIKITGTELSDEMVKYFVRKFIFFWTFSIINLKFKIGLSRTSFISQSYKITTEKSIHSSNKQIFVKAIKANQIFLQKFVIAITE